MDNTPKEWALLQKIRAHVHRPDENTVVGLGDDAFVFKNFPGYSVLCQDMLVEGNHFRREWTTPSDLGHKALAVNLSDMAAMGARPHYAQISLALPANITENWLDDFYKGATALADQFQCRIVGGDLTSADKLVIDVSVHGSCENPLTRQGAQVGDLLLVSGPLGLSHTGLLALQQELPDFPEALKKHRSPLPRLDLISSLQKYHAQIHALMDCSDGLINDALHLAGQSGLNPQSALGLEIFAETLPLHEETHRMAQKLARPSQDFALWGGEDYELLLVIPPPALPLFPEFKMVGQFTDQKGIFLKDGSQKSEISKFLGWKHF